MVDYTGHLTSGACAIFLFHGVIPEQTHPVRNYTRKHLERARFRQIVEGLAREGTAISLDAFLAGQIPPRSFAVTFDDGFENNASVAAPILDELNVPATFYVTSRFVDENAPSWIDSIEAAVEAALEARLVLPFPPFAVGARTAAEKIAALDAIRQGVKSDRSIEPYTFAAGILEQLQVPEQPWDPALDAKLTWPQVASLADNPLFTVGAHGHTHAILEHLDDSALEREVAFSTRMLAEHTGREVRHFSYPEGLDHCFSPRVIDALKRHGIICSPTALPGLNAPGDDPFRLRRIMVER